MKPAKFTPIVVAPVTFETVRERLSYLEGLNAKGAGTAVKSQQYEIACLRELLVRLEPRTVKMPKLKMLEDYLAEVAIEERKQILVGVKLEFHRACATSGIKVEAE
ncbi:hypothetical protein L1K12_24395 [Klebsiella pneumoniae]|uniref:hypothetical protein n=1 Tax=Klebsiella pneumoniae TaxID=573 RepID=UPI001F3E37B2|nr:hypothetical protein [Klebsiella pneumoniae]MCF1902297.1 hypothetical protein [Klebsiella pneumoniae]